MSGAPSDFRSGIGRVRGLGSAKGGTQHWIAQRLTAIALIPLSLWFIGGVICHATADYATAVNWVKQPVNTALLLAFVIATFYHAVLGMQVVIEDYVQVEWLKITLLTLLKLGAGLLTLIAVVSILKVSLGV